MENSATQKMFLTAEWRHLAMLNFGIDPATLSPFVPTGTELDFWEGKALISVVGFLFLKTRVLGLPIPLHQDFEEVNLRFYVRRKAEEGWRRGVVFIREIVPKRMIAFVARRFYNEPYLALPMSHNLAMNSGNLHSAEYRWVFNQQKNSLRVVTQGYARDLEPGSEAEFITEHYWGYNKQRDGSTLEYRVDHPRWRVYEADESAFDGDAAALYGKEFSKSLGRKPSSAFLAVGSQVTVYKGAPIRA